MSGRRAKALRREAGNPPKPIKVKTPLLDRAYIHHPVRYDFQKAQWVYRSPKQVRKFLARQGVDVEALAAELELLMSDIVEQEKAVEV